MAALLAQPIDRANGTDGAERSIDHVLKFAQLHYEQAMSRNLGASAMKRMFLRIFPALLVLTGCAEANSIFRKDRIAGTDPVVYTVDAKQRVVLSQQPIAGSSGGTKYRRFCAEPSPDVFSVLSQAASASGTLGLDKDARTLNAALQAAFANSETGSTIPRTQTINMLREMMFRTCERYLNGAISDIEFPIVAARDQHIMVSILAIEQLTGAIAPKPVIISNGGSASTGQNATEMMKLLAKAKEDLETADAGLVEANDKQKAADTGAGAGGCAALEKADKPDATKLKACTDAKAEVESATATRDKADAFYKQQSKIATTAQGVSSASASPGSATDPKDWTLAQATAVKNVAWVVRAIVKDNFDQDETQFFCMKQFDPIVTRDTRRAIIERKDRALENALSEVQFRCLEYLMARVKKQTALLYGLNPATFAGLTMSGQLAGREDVGIGKTLLQCLADPKKLAAVETAMTKDKDLMSEIPALRQAIANGGEALGAFVRDLPRETHAKPFKTITDRQCS